MSGDGKGGGETQTATQTVQIPEFLRPFVEQSANVGSTALGRISEQTGPDANFVAPLNATQNEALGLQEAFARGEGGFLPDAQEALQSTARGDFLFGGPGFNEAVDASIRAAQPSILSSFGRAGRGVSGLGQQAIQQTASDAFARLFGQERQRQLAAATALPNIGLSGANVLSQVGAQRQAQSQRELSAPLAAQERLLSAALGVTPSQSGLFGQQSTQAVGGGGSKAGDALGAGLSIAGLAVGGPAGASAGSLGGNLLSKALLGE